MANVLVPESNVQSSGAMGTLVYCALLIARAYGAKIPDEVIAALPGAAVIITAYIHDVIDKIIAARQSK